MVAPSRPPANGFVRAVRHIYNPIGFSKGYNFVLFFIFGGALLGFALARLMYLDFDGVFCAEGGALPGECYHYESLRGRIGIMLHLWAILPAAILVILQFTPVIRHKVLLFHRINGYLIILLSLAATGGVFMIAEFSFGGDFGKQTAMGLAATIFIVCKALALYNVKRLQIEQHRAWMLRAWILAGFVVTMRLIMVVMVEINTALGNTEHYTAMSCAIIDHMYTGAGGQEVAEADYPGCAAWYSGAEADVYVVVQADPLGTPIPEVATAHTESVGSAIWLALFIHILGAELYLRLTPKESERLRKVSYQRQLEAGYSKPGSAGLTAQIGDAEPYELKDLVSHAE